MTLKKTVLCLQRQSVIKRMTQVVIWAKTDDSSLPYQNKSQKNKLISKSKKIQSDIKKKKRNYQVKIYIK